jgi:hypothetical protein
VLTGSDGKVLATFRHPDQNAGAHPLPKFGLTAASGQRLHEIELPSHMEGIRSAEELHRALKQHLSR